MPEDKPPSSLADSAAAAPQQDPPIPFNIGEEYGTAKKNLPPASIVLIVLVAAAVVVAIVVFLQRPKSAATGSIEDVVAVDIPNQNAVMVALNVSLQNRGEKTYWIKSIKAALDTKDGHYTDDAASAVDFDRYFQAFPALKQHALAALIPEQKTAAGGSLTGTVIVSFPVTAEAFSSRKLLTLTIQPYDGVALVLSK